MAKPKSLGHPNYVPPLTRVSDLYDTYPMTVWELSAADMHLTLAIKDIVGDKGEARADSASMGFRSIDTKGADAYVSVFNPQIIGTIIDLYRDEIGPFIYDPFGGGGTRGIISAYEGYDYLGMEIRDEEVRSIDSNIATIQSSHGIPSGSCIMYCGDSRRSPLKDGQADTIITCPPYWNMEKYNGGPDDLSMASTYDQYLDMLYVVVEECLRVLKPGGLAFWITGLHRDSDGHLLPINRDVQAIHGRLGMPTREEVILYKRRSTTAPRRMGTYLKGRHLLIRNHEYLTIFTKEA